MFAVLVLIVSVALLFFYFQVVTQKILRRQFTQDYFQSIVTANRFEFLSVRKAIEASSGSMEYSRLSTTLKCDFLGLTYLLKHVDNVNLRYTLEERLLMLYFRMRFASLAACHWLRWRENSDLIKLTDILLYFANVLGERIDKVRLADLTLSDFLNM